MRPSFMQHIDRRNQQRARRISPLARAELTFTAQNRRGLRSRDRNIPIRILQRYDLPLDGKENNGKITTRNTKRKSMGKKKRKKKSKVSPLLFVR